MIDTTRTFIRESYQELRKVSWPGRKEIIGSSLVVISSVLFFVLVVWLVDLVIKFSIGALLK
jgi:preprotein translocase subunit SecE